VSGLDDVIGALNAARARELAVIIQYMDHHYVAGGLEGLPSAMTQGRGDTWVRSRGTGLAARLVGTPDAVTLFKSVALVEMRHAQSFGNRVTALGGTPTVVPAERHEASTVRAMLELDLAAESEAVEQYEESIDLCRAAGDEESRVLFERILADEHAHHDAFRDLLTERS
jgi:bacterioferritin